MDHTRKQLARRHPVILAVFQTGLVVMLMILLAESRGVLLAKAGPRGNAVTPKSSIGSWRAAHKFHVSYSRMGVEGRTILVRVRFFTDDLQEAIRAETKVTDYIPEATPRADSIFTAYFNASFRITIENSVLVGQLAGSGEEEENGQAMNWYLVQYDAHVPITEVRIDNTLLAKTFDDQKNLLKVQHFPSEKTRSYYFESKSDPIDIRFDS